MSKPYIPLLYNYSRRIGSTHETEDCKGARESLLYPLRSLLIMLVAAPGEKPYRHTRHLQEFTGEEHGR